MSPAVEQPRWRSLGLRCLILIATATLGPAALAQTMDEAADLLQAGRVEQAVSKLLDVAERAIADDPGLAAAAWSNACVLESNLGRYREALAHCQRALDVHAGHSGLRDGAGQARILNNLGRTLLGLGRWAEAEQQFRQALALNQKIGDAEGQTINLLNLGVTADRQARFAEALRRYDDAATTIGNHRGEAWAEEQRTIALLNRAALLERIGAHDDALSIYLGLLDAAAGDTAFEASLEANLAVVYRNLGDAEEAERRLERAVLLYESNGDRAGLANAILNLGLLRHRNLGRPAGGEVDLERALDLARETGDRAEEIQALYYLGGALLDQGRWDEAESAFTECAALASDSGSAEGRWSAAEGQGRVAEARGDFPAAVAHFTTAMSAIESARAELADSPRRAGFFGAQRPVYAAAVRTFVALAELEPDSDWNRRAVEVARRAKARDLVEALHGTAAQSSMGSPGMPEERPEVFSPASGLEIFLGDARWYSWRVDGVAARLVGTGEAAPLLERTERVRRSLARGAAPAERDLEWLSDNLLGTGELPSELAIAPDGRLWYLPFDLLPVDIGGGRAQPLLEHTTLRYLPGGAAAAWSTPGPHPTDITFLGLAPLGGGDITLPAHLAGGEVEPLPASERELESAAHALGGRVVLLRGREATERAFHQAVAPPGARVLHLASHTLVNEGRRDGTAIVLAPDGEDDGLLVPAEISASRIDVDLTVLAACSSIVGFEDDGLGLATLTGALLAAGSRAVLATQWPVDDTTSAAFFEQFYDRLGRGAAPAEALRLTKTTLRADPRWSNPSLWAGFVLIGDTGPVHSSAGRWPSRLTATALMAVVLLAGLVWLARRRAGRLV